MKKHWRTTLTIFALVGVLFCGAAVVGAASVRVGVQIPDLGQGSSVRLQTAVTTTNQTRASRIAEDLVWTATAFGGAPVAIDPLADLSENAWQSFVGNLVASTDAEDLIITIAVY